MMSQVMMSQVMMSKVMMSKVMTSSSSFKEKNGCRCLARARTNMKNKKETVYHCFNFCEMFAQFDVSF